jgi:hypothetical protein
MEEVHSQLSAMADITNDLYSIKALRKSTHLAEKVLNCAICFDTTWRPSEVSGNALLLGSLLLTIATCYRNKFTRHQQKATESTRNVSPVRLFLGHEIDENSLVELHLSGIDYRHLLHSGFRSEFERLSGFY